MAEIDPSPSGMRAPTALALGLSAGVLGAAMGGGGGLLMVPVLGSCSGLTRPAVSGTSTLGNAGIAAAGVICWGVLSTVDWTAALSMGMGAALGAVAGVRLLRRIRAQHLRALLVAVLFLSIFKVLRGGGEAATASAEAWPLVSVALCAVTGVAVGAWSSAMGLGGGLLAVPALVFLGSPLPVALATSLVVMLPATLVGTASHLHAGSADLRLGAWLAGGAAAGTALGIAALGHVPLAALKAFYCAVLAVIAFRELKALWISRSGS
jgi:uncharacterized protein